MKRLVLIVIPLLVLWAMSQDYADNRVLVNNFSIEKISTDENNLSCTIEKPEPAASCSLPTEKKVEAKPSPCSKCGLIAKHWHDFPSSN